MKKINLKIYYEDLIVHIVPISAILSEEKNRLIYEGFKIMPASLFSLLETLKGKGLDIYIASADPHQYFKSFSMEFSIIRAAGGVVINESGEYLMIFRHGKWDLPKGKIEEGENPEIAACREVNEECGISLAETAGFLCHTFHIYPLRDEFFFKETSWFLMHYEGNEELIPQEEEGITKLEWVNSMDLENHLKNSYGTIRDVMDTQKENT
jgi:8-oxo-dGTP pyrophosphatase MutT (NUDIX family)